VIPLKDDVPSRSVPVVTVTLITLNVLAYLYQVSLGLDPRGPGAGAAEAFILEFGVIPCRLSGACPPPLAAIAEDLPHPWLTVVTSMFLHGGLLHIGGNMLYLWIFGNNVEDTLGHGRFLVFYLASGVAAAVGQTLVNPSSAVPMIGASGAVSGVLGAYLVLFPYATILTLIVFGFFVRFVHVPALVVLGFWIVVQVLNGYLTVSAQAMGRGETGGVAWFAHIGGFLAGLVLLFLLRRRRSRRL
jgi:membrane associated rhomboid family serine protease